MKYFLLGAGLLIFALTSMTCHSPTEPSSNSADTTSNDWTFTETMLGDGGGSQLYGVCIVNDTLAYAVGQVYLKDSTGQLNPVLYNATVWNGSSWDAERIPYIYNGNPTYSAITWVYSINTDDVWFANSTHWNGSTFQNIDIGTSVFYGVGTNKMWGTDNNIYVVGNQGTIGRFDGSSWQKLSSGTTLDIQDVYGYGGTVLAVASNPGESLDKEILQINGTTVTQLSTAGIQWPLSSVWFVPGHYYVVGQGIYEKTSLSQSTWQEDSVDTVDFFSCIRGNAWNDFFVAGGYGQLLHFNGKTWRSYQDVLGLQQGGIASVAVKGNLMIGVGYLGSKAVAFVGRRQN